nr:hypothetical protein [Treponema brennaborense]
MENQKKMNTTTTVFGNELHRYSIADGIRDKNVLGFDPYKILTYKDKDLRKAVALDKSQSKIVEEALADPKKSEVFNKFMDSSKVKMAGFVGDDGKDVKGIEDYISNSQYRRKEHQQQVINDILGDYVRLSNNGMFHSIFATSSIDEAIEYYRLIKKQKPELKITALFDPNIDNNDGFALKEDGLIEIISDYNQRYGVDFSLATHAQFKKDIAARLSHKEPYILIERTPEKELDLLIVVDQMLTGFDSKWINTLYLDKILEYENIIQAFSRTNRLFGEKKPFGIIKYYRKPHTMERNIQDAVKLYSGDKPIGMFVERLSFNIKKMNEVFADISDLFSKAGSDDFTKLPEDKTERGKFAKAFKQLNEYLESARVQGFTWDKLQYEVTENKDEEEQTTSVSLNLDENTYLAMALRYKELFSGKDSDSEGSEDVPYEIEGYLTEIDTDKIDVDYMNSRFTKYLKILSQENVTEEQLEQGLNDLHKSFAFLTQEEQKYANIFIHDVQMGNVEVDSNISFREYVSLYQHNAENEQVSHLCSALGLDEKKLRSMMNCCLTENNINEFGRFDELKASVDKEKAKSYFEQLEGNPVSPFAVNIKIQTLLQKFLLSGGIEIEK